MRMTFLILILFIQLNKTIGQPNCNWYKFQGDLKKYEACLEAEKRAGHYQFSKAYQLALDRSIAIDSTWAYAYRAKSTAYLKSGDFVTWKKLMDKAVKYDPIENLDYRGWCRFQFFRDYQGAIDDLMRLKTLTNNRIGYSVNGDYHLDIALALCYKSIGQIDTAVQIILEKFSDTTFTSGLYDHLHLGVMYLEKENYLLAIEQFKLQEDKYDLAENRFYMALAYKSLAEKDNYLTNLSMAKALYQKNQKMFDPYTERVDKIYLSEILEEEKSVFGNRGIPD